MVSETVSPARASLLLGDADPALELELFDDDFVGHDGWSCLSDAEFQFADHGRAEARFQFCESWVEDAIELVVDGRLQHADGEHPFFQALRAECLATNSPTISCQPCHLLLAQPLAEAEGAHAASSSGRRSLRGVAREGFARAGRAIRRSPRRDLFASHAGQQSKTPARDERGFGKWMGQALGPPSLPIASTGQPSMASLQSASSSGDRAVVNVRVPAVIVSGEIRRRRLAQRSQSMH